MDLDEQRRLLDTKATRKTIKIDGTVPFCVAISYFLIQNYIDSHEKLTQLIEINALRNMMLSNHLVLRAST